MVLLSFLITGALLALTSASPQVLEARAKCNADNCARAVTGTNVPTSYPPKSSRLADCSSFVACTVTPATSTVSATTTVTPALSLVTVIGGTSVAVVVTSTEVDVVTSLLTLAERQAGSGGGAVTNCPSSVPRYASACSGSARYSSACSCFGATPTTSTASTPVVTTTVTQTAVAPVSTVLQDTTITQFSVATLTSAAVVTITPECTTVTGDGERYARYYSGFGTTENPTNPGNIILSPSSTTFTVLAATPDCTAISSCADYAARLPGIYYSFDVHYLLAQGAWECKAYFETNTSPAYFDQANPLVGPAYGYSHL